MTVPHKAGTSGDPSFFTHKLVAWWIIAWTSSRHLDTQGWTGRKIQPWHFLSRPAHYIISTRGGTRRTGRTLYIRIIVQFFVFQVCVSCAADKKGVKPEQEVNRHPVVAASQTAISTTKPLLNITHDPTLNPLLQLLVCDCENRLV